MIGLNVLKISELDICGKWKWKLGNWECNNIWIVTVFLCFILLKSDRKFYDVIFSIFYNEKWFCRNTTQWLNSALIAALQVGKIRMNRFYSVISAQVEQLKCWSLKLKHRLYSKLFYSMTNKIKFLCQCYIIMCYYFSIIITDCNIRFKYNCTICMPGAIPHHFGMNKIGEVSDFLCYYDSYYMRHMNLLDYFKMGASFWKKSKNCFVKFLNFHNLRISVKFEFLRITWGFENCENNFLFRVLFSTTERFFNHFYFIFQYKNA